VSRVDIPVLETARLRLRSLADADLDAFAAMLGDAEVMRYLGDGRPMDRVGAWRKMALLVGHWQLRGYGIWAVVDRTTGSFVGRVGLWNPEGWPGLEVGWILPRERWGQGFAREAAEAALRFAFERLGADRVISVIHPENARSIRVAERLGERFEQSHVIGEVGVSIYAIGHEEWRARG
jgi:RimJ/RimL family protein N-acetyltransferase